MEIPTRIAIGFTQGEWDDIQEIFKVKSKHASRCKACDRARREQVRREAGLTTEQTRKIAAEVIKLLAEADEIKNPKPKVSVSLKPVEDRGNE